MHVKYKDSFYIFLTSNIHLILYLPISILTCRCSGLFVVKTIGGVAPLDSVDSPVPIKNNLCYVVKLFFTFEKWTVHSFYLLGQSEQFYI